MRGKLFVGPRIRLLREQQGLTLEACAGQLRLSASYLSQIETNQRPVTARVLIALSKVFGLNPGEFDADDENRLIADLREASADLALGDSSPSLAELKLAAATTPTLAHQFLELHRSFRRLDERLKTLDETLSMDGQNTPEALLPYEEVRDFFHYRDNYIDELDTEAEALAAEIGIGNSHGAAALLEQFLHSRLGMEVVRELPTEGSRLLRKYDPVRKLITLASDLPESTRAFQLAVQVAELVFGEVFSAVLQQANLKTKTAENVARVGLANYAAGALLMPYRHFATTALNLRHDIEQLQRRYGASFEQVCHRLSNLQRPGARGVPFYFVRVDQAGNITKRHSATRFQFARFGGACPLWNVHEAFGQPGKILVQIAEMPDRVRYLCVGRSIVKRSGSYQQPSRHFAVGIGCEVTHADQVVYSEGLRLDGPAVPIGISCRICERLDCHQRAFPPIDRKLTIPANERYLLPYVL
jgi:XRE family transcriptional regulator, fatty acid utilization regulator